MAVAPNCWRVREGKINYVNRGENRMEKKSIRAITSLVFRAVTLAMGVAVVALSCLDVLEPRTALSLLGIGLACAGLAMLEEK